ncbi:MAG: hypothetical protein KDA41_07765 [Planctomycetales bacterium]|nr:hypothetical protein [Planctomycetales bacterium]
MTTKIEQINQERMDALSPKERIARSGRMLRWARACIARQIQAQRGPLSDERLKWEVALRMYGSDPRARATIERKLADVSD